MPSPVVQIEGAKEFRKAVRGYETDTEWKPLFKNAYVGIAQSTATAIQSAAGVTRLGSAGTADIAGKATMTGASIVAFKNTPYGAGFNFGSVRYRQFPPKASPDWFLYATIQAKKAEIQAEVLDAIEASFASAGL